MDIEKSVLEYSLRMETAFRYGEQVSILRGSFVRQPKEALFDGLHHLNAAGLVPAADINYLVETVGFLESDSLKTYIERCGTKQLDELIVSIKNMKEGRRDR